MDAVRDLDDPLTMVHLFATLPAEKLHGIPASVVQTSRRLALEWQVWRLLPVQRAPLLLVLYQASMDAAGPREARDRAPPCRMDLKTRVMRC